jgi:hypothetical protein
MTDQPGARGTVYHLAQVNVGRPVAPLTDPALEGFVAALEPVNALADAAPGFVWRLQTEDGDATAIRVFDDDALIVNMSVWETLPAFSDFVFRTMHVEVMRMRRRWFEPMREAITALWWVPAGHRPTVAEAEARLVALRTHGPGPDAFTLRQPFPPPGDAGGVVVAPDDTSCPA